MRPDRGGPYCGGVVRVLCLLVVSALVLGAGCSSDRAEQPEPTSRLAGVYAASIRWVVGQQEGPVDGSLPVVYVVSSDERTVPAADQAQVVKALKDVATVRFADRWEDALDEDVAGQPVHDTGVLLGMGPVPEGDPIEVPVRVYRTASDEQLVTLTLDEVGGTWTVVDSAATG